MPALMQMVFNHSPDNAALTRSNETLMLFEAVGVACINHHLIAYSRGCAHHQFRLRRVYLGCSAWLEYVFGFLQLFGRTVVARRY